MRQAPLHRHAPRCWRSSAGAASAATLDDVKARGTLKCGVNTGFAGFAVPGRRRRVAGLRRGPLPRRRRGGARRPEKVEFTPTTGETRFTALTSGEIDVLSRNSTWTFTRDVDLKFTFAGVNYYDGQGFMVSKDLGVTSALELDGATVCIQTGTTTELNLADFFKANNISYQPVPIQTPAEADQQFLGGACDAYTTDASQLATQRATYENPDNYIILPGDHLQGAARPAGAPGRRPVGRHRALDAVTRWSLPRSTASPQEQRRGDDQRPRTPRSGGCSASRATSG